MQPSVVSAALLSLLHFSTNCTHALLPGRLALAHSAQTTAKLCCELHPSKRPDSRR